MDRKLLEDLWQHHGGKLLGALTGMLVGVLVILFGFFQTLFVMVCMTAGYVIGKRIDEKEDIMDIIDRLIPPGYYR